jgi:penicillin-binding protein 1A
VARNFFLSSKRTLDRKIREAMLAMKIEQQLSKDQILELYMNQIYLGHRAYGFGAAAQVYFGKPLDQLSIAEDAMLAGLPQNPGYANPITNLERAVARQHVVLGRMLATGVITQAQYDEAKAQKLVIRSENQVAVHAEHVAEMARQIVYQRFGEQAYSEGFKVTTSLIAADQQAAWSALRRGVLDHERRQAWRGPEDQEDLGDDTGRRRGPGGPDPEGPARRRRPAGGPGAAGQPQQVEAVLATGEKVTLKARACAGPSGLSPKAPDTLAVRRGSVIRVVKADKGGWAIAQWPQAQSAFVSLDPATGRVRALVGGFDFTRQQFNHATQAWRQPAPASSPSCTRPRWSTACSRPRWSTTRPGPWGRWLEPAELDGQFDGPISLRRALAKSKNLVSIRLVQYIGVDTARQWAGRFGFDVNRQPDNLTLALGAGSTTPMQLATAYAALANGGYKVDPVVIERITDAQGQVVYQAPPPVPLTEAQRIIPARNAFVIDSLLNEVTRSGTAARAQAALKRPDIYGKTGTTNDAVDAWFAGFQPSVVAVVWMGYDDPRSLGSRESGGGASLPIWISYMDQVLRNVPVHSTSRPRACSRSTASGTTASTPRAAS